MKRHALFVGVNKYSDSTIQNLNYSSEDATELASVFRHLLKFDRVEKLINPGHSPEIVDAVNDMTRGLGTGDLFLFFFAGHGFRVKENHVLVCAKDEFLDLEDEYAGLQVGRLKKRMRGPWNRMLVLDACQNDIRATRGADCGIASRDLELIHAYDEDVADSGVQIVITSCSEGEKALESSDLKHGLFTSAFLHAVTSVDGKSSGINLESLRMNVGARMNNLIKRYHLLGKQTPMFTMPPNAGDIILLDGEISEPDVQRKPLSHVFVVCPMCGRKNSPADTFRCRQCGKDNLCLRHQDEKTFLCFSCAEKSVHKGVTVVEERKESKTNSIKRVQLWEGGPYWADRNIGAENPWDSGYYFWWGDTVGYKWVNDEWVASDGSNSDFSFEYSNAPTDYKAVSELNEGWITENGVLVPEHDPAQKHWGGNWRMPTDKELQDLSKLCDWTWTKVNGVNGYVVRGRGAYSSASIFLPCAGHGHWTSLNGAGSYGIYWSSVPNSDYSYSWYLYFYSGDHFTNYGYRSRGQSVRPLKGFTE